MNEYDIEQLIESLVFVWEDYYDNYEDFIKSIKQNLQDYNQ
jgi:hypothetical protein